MDEEKIPQKPEIPYETVYANNTSIEVTFWDLKIIFGEIDQYGGKFMVDWHTAVTMPWAQAKLLAYFMRLQLAWYETQHGTIGIPGSIIPPALEVPKEAAGDPAQKAFYDFATRLHVEIFKS